MNRQELDALIGLHFDDAADKVYEVELKPEVLHKDTITASITLPKNVVRIVYDGDGNVISAETQASIDERYK